MSFRFDIKVTEDLKEKVVMLSEKESVTLTNIVKAFILDCVKNDKLPFSIAEIPTFEGLNLARINARFDDDLEECVNKFKKICERNFIPCNVVIRTYLFLCHKDGKILIKPDFSNKMFCNRTYK